MAELEEEFNVVIPCEKVILRTNAHKDRITIDKISLEDNQAASIAWLANQTSGTLLEVLIKVKT